MRRTHTALTNAVLRLPIELRERRRWRSLDASGLAKVYYGFDRLPSGRNLSGGLVKAQDLQASFPNQPRGANVLYLISSALPRLADTMARRAKSAGAKVVINQNGVAYPGWHGAGWERTNRPMQTVLKLADHVFYQSRFCQETADQFLAVQPTQSEVLYNPVDTTVFAPAARAPASASPRLLLAGSHHSFYRVQSAVDCLKIVRTRLPAAQLRIAGRYVWRASETEALAELRAYIAQRELQSSVELTGAYSQTEAATLLQGAHMLLHTKYNDPCPRLVVEALACGLPVVYSATGGVPELVGDAAGIGVPGPRDYNHDHPPSPELLADAVVAISARLAAFSGAARERAVTRFDVKPWLQRHAEVFQTLLASRTTS